MSSVKVMNIWQCNPDAEDTFEQELKRLFDTSVVEGGCMSYEIYQPKDSQSEYIVLEEWADEDALGRHQNSPQYKHFIRIVPVLQACPPKNSQLKRLI
ncbi:putative quinol monooxygenase [Mucilaginibacter agri]|uniref:ABM domain-containing protein n=1 Tax=Mucilaginibacter agri TaxID=2695265 RepID=A0A966DVP7_9SPHI|nr:putative quinol monooxygenase [Mucilaginibacter agri]NCD70734.1 hypothetical protein [Mucilaginibacter agri]